MSHVRFSPLTSMRTNLLTTTLLAATLLAACSKPQPKVVPPVAVTVATARTGAAPYVLTANGVVEPRQSVAVQSQVAGTLVRVHFREGDEVKQGQLLFQIDPRPYQAALRQAEAALARDQAQAENAKRDADRFATLVQKDYVTKSQADQANASAAAQGSVVESDRAAVENARLNVENASIRAAVTGKTGSLLVREGNLVRPGTGSPLVVINQIHPILVRFNVPERSFPDIQRYGAGKPLTVRATPQNGGAPVEGKLTFIDNGVDSTTGTVTLKGEFANTDGRLWPGQFATVHLELYVQKNALLVPTPAVLTGQNGTYVFVVDAENKAQPQPVTAGRAVGDSTIIEKGLAVGTRVVVDGQARLGAGTQVTIKPALVPGAPSADTAATITVGITP